MYTQIATFRILPGKITSVVRAFKHELVPDAQKINGFLHADLFTRSRLNKGVALLYWETEFASKEAAKSGRAPALWQAMEPYLTKGVVIEGYEPNHLGDASGDPETRNEATVRRANQAFSEKNMEALLACYADDAVQYEPFLEEPITGNAALRRYFDGSFVYFPDEEIDIERLIPRGKWVVGQWRCRGTQTGEFIGLPPTGRRFDVPECAVYEFSAEGLIQNLWVYVDSGTIAKQLGYGWDIGTTK
jgi:steroid delta-isomerase-like uncharacterized protein